MQKIVPHLWFDTQAKEAAEFYTSIFPSSRIVHTSKIHNTPSGDCDIVTFQLWGYEFQAISAGPYFKPNPSISFMVNFDPSQDVKAETKLNTLWAKLMEGGKALMPLDTYPFSKRYGWVQDKYGFSWQLILTDPKGEPRPHIMPSMLFVKSVCGKAEEATNLYLSTIKPSKRGVIARYPAGMEPDREGSIMFTDLQLADTWLVAMDSAHNHEFTFNEAVSLIIQCETQEEIDYVWSQLSAVPEAEQCGWIKDVYGVSWQIVPTAMQKMMNTGTQEQIDRVTKAFLPMKKLDIAIIQKVFEGK